VHAQPGSQNLSNLLKQAHIKQQQSTKGHQSLGGGDKTPPLLPPSFFGGQQQLST
jgi:hypothetical protein